MATEKQEKVLFNIVDGPPELDLVCSLMRHTKVKFTLEKDGIKREINVTITCIDSKNVAFALGIKGLFYGDGKTGWLTFPKKNNNGDDKVEEYALWGRFEGTYIMKKCRSGNIITENFRVETYYQGRDDE